MPKNTVCVPDNKSGKNEYIMRMLYQLPIR